MRQPFGHGQQQVECRRFFALRKSGTCEVVKRVDVMAPGSDRGPNDTEVHSDWPCIPLVPIKAATASRSTGLRSGCQTSNMKTTRSSPLGLAASCSIVSSNTNASPGVQKRLSSPTLNQQPSGTTRGKWQTKRELLMPTCGGIVVCG